MLEIIDILGERPFQYKENYKNYLEIKREKRALLQDEHAKKKDNEDEEEENEENEDSNHNNNTLINTVKKWNLFVKQQLSKCSFVIIKKDNL